MASVMASDGSSTITQQQQQQQQLGFSYGATTSPSATVTESFRPPTSSGARSHQQQTAGSGVASGRPATSSGEQQHRFDRAYADVSASTLHLGGQTGAEAALQQQQQQQQQVNGGNAHSTSSNRLHEQQAAALALAQQQPYMYAYGYNTSNTRPMTAPTHSLLNGGAGYNNGPMFSPATYSTAGFPPNFLQAAQLQAQAQAQQASASGSGLHHSGRVGPSHYPSGRDAVPGSSNGVPPDTSGSDIFGYAPPGTAGSLSGAPQLPHAPQSQHVHQAGQFAYTRPDTGHSVYDDLGGRYRPGTSDTLRPDTAVSVFSDLGGPYPHSALNAQQAALALHAASLGSAGVSMGLPQVHPAYYQAAAAAAAAAASNGGSHPPPYPDYQHPSVLAHLHQQQLQHHHAQHLPHQQLDPNADGKAGHLQAHQQQQKYSFIPLPSQPKKRPRRRFEEIERLYNCNYPGCKKAYGTLNHLNAHVSMQKHGPKRIPSEFKEIRKAWRQRKKDSEAAAARGEKPHAGADAGAGPDGDGDSGEEDEGGGGSGLNESLCASASQHIPNGTSNMLSQSAPAASFAPPPPGPAYQAQIPSLPDDLKHQVRHPDDITPPTSTQFPAPATFAHYAGYPNATGGGNDRYMGASRAHPYAQVSSGPDAYAYSAPHSEISPGSSYGGRPSTAPGHYSQSGFGAAASSPVFPGGHFMASGNGTGSGGASPTLHLHSGLPQGYIPALRKQSITSFPPAFASIQEEPAIEAAEEEQQFGYNPPRTGDPQYQSVGYEQPAHHSHDPNAPTSVVSGYPYHASEVAQARTSRPGTSGSTSSPFQFSANHFIAASDSGLASEHAPSQAHSRPGSQGGNVPQRHYIAPQQISEEMNGHKGSVRTESADQPPLVGTWSPGWSSLTRPGRQEEIR